MVIKIKGGEWEEVEENSDRNMGLDQMMEEVAAVAALGGARRNRKRYIGVRQRPSGRWVAEIKDTIQKIRRVWLGTYDTAEEAARAYDEAACLLRGANTRTNFWPCSPTLHSTPALPAKITNLLLLRLKARHIASASTATSLPVDIREQEIEVKDNHFDSFFNVPEDYTIYEISDTITNSASAITTSDNIAQSFGSSLAGLEEGCVRALDKDDNWTNVDGKSHGAGEEEEIGDKEDFDMALIDLQFVYAVGSTCYCSPFEIAEEMVKLMEQENHGDEPSMLGETMKRLMYERKFSASLYAFKGIPECLMHKQEGLANGTEMSEQFSNHSNHRNNGNTNREKKDTQENIQTVVQEQVGIPQKSTEKGSSSSSSFLSTENGEPCLWGSLNLPPICSI